MKWYKWRDDFSDKKIVDEFKMRGVRGVITRGIAHVMYKIGPKYMRCYSQNGEDVLIAFYLGNRESISYIDIGANQPKRLSNTYLLSKKYKVRKGVLVEANPLLIPALKRIRKKETILNVGVTDGENGVMTFFLMNANTLSSFEESHIKEWEKYGYYKVDEKKINVVNINDLLHEHFANEKIDLLSIDVEGLDEKILYAIDFEKFRPEVICFETFDNIDAMRNYFSENGYRELAKTMVNTIMVNDR